MAANLYRYKVVLSGWDGAPGVNTLYFRWSALPILEDYQSVATLIGTAYQTMRNHFLTGMSINVDPEVQVIQDTTGTLQTTAVITPPTTVTGNGSELRQSRATMMLASFKTDQVVNGRQLRGRSFLGPISTTSLDTNGNISTQARTDIVQAYQGLLDVSGGRLVVWHRPSGPGASDGDSGFVQQVVAPLKPAVLRSRRD